MNASTVNDVELIELTLAGDSASFGQLVLKYQDRLFHTVVRVVGCREEARDVVQEAFVQAFVKLDTFEQNAAFYTWLYRIAVNLGISRRRKKKPTVSIDQAREATGIEPPDTTRPPSESLEHDERAQQVHAGLAALSDEHRTILVLREMEGCSYETISSILNMPIGTVRSRIYRARIQLRDRLKPLLAEEVTNQKQGSTQDNR